MTYEDLERENDWLWYVKTTLDSVCLDLYEEYGTNHEVSQATRETRQALCKLLEKHKKIKHESWKAKHGEQLEKKYIRMLDPIKNNKREETHG